MHPPATACRHRALSARVAIVTAARDLTPSRRTGRKDKPDFAAAALGGGGTRRRHRSRRAAAPSAHLEWVGILSPGALVVVVGLGGGPRFVSEVAASLTVLPMENRIPHDERNETTVAVFATVLKLYPSTCEETRTRRPFQKPNRHHHGGPVPRPPRFATEPRDGLGTFVDPSH